MTRITPDAPNHSGIAPEDGVNARMQMLEAIEENERLCGRNGIADQLKEVRSYLLATQADKDKRIGEAIQARIDICRANAADCPAWSAAQGEWLRAKDALLDLQDDIAALKDNKDRG